MKKRKLVKKHVVGIHCSNRLRLLDRKIFNVLLHKAQSEEGLETHCISVEELTRTVGFSSRNIKHLMSSIISLTQTTISFNLCNDNVGSGAWFSSSILASASSSSGVIYFELSAVIRNLFLNPNIYGLICLQTQEQIKSKYALALYENCVRYKKIGRTRPFSFDVLRLLLGAEAPSYDKFSVFKQKILVPAVLEVNLKTDILVKPFYEKRGRAVFKIGFHVLKGPRRKKEGSLSRSSSKRKEVEKTVFKGLQKLSDVVVSDLESEFLSLGANMHKKYTQQILKKSGGFKNPILLDDESGGGLSFLKKHHPELIERFFEEDPA